LACVLAEEVTVVVDGIMSRNHGGENA
jgi:hypothetical protein